MALIKQFTEANGNTGEYWRITEVNASATAGKSFCNLQLYKSQEVRNNGGLPMGTELKFVFTADEIEAMDADENMPSGWRDVYFHVHYLAIKAAAVSGYGKSDEQLSNNERLAQVLHGATDG